MQLDYGDCKPCIEAYLIYKNYWEYAQLEVDYDPIMADEPLQSLGRTVIHQRSGMRRKIRIFERIYGGNYLTHNFTEALTSNT